MLVFVRQVLTRIHANRTKDVTSLPLGVIRALCWVRWVYVATRLLPAAPGSPLRQPTARAASQVASASFAPPNDAAAGTDATNGDDRTNHPPFLSRSRNYCGGGSNCPTIDNSTSTPFSLKCGIICISDLYMPGLPGTGVAVT